MCELILVRKDGYTINNDIAMIDINNIKVDFLDK